MPTRLLILLAAVAVINGCMPAENIKHMDSQLAVLQKQNQQLSSALQAVKKNESKNEQALRMQYASLKAEFQNFREETQSLQGELQQTRYLLEQHIAVTKTKQTEKERRTQEFNQILLARISQLEKYLGLEAAPDGSTEAPEQSNDENKPADVAPQAPSISTSSEEGLYASALQTFKLGDYPATRDIFKKFLETYPDSEMCDNARFWIGETYYREKWYEKAILEYQKVITDYPNGNKIPAALLKQGMSFHNIDDNTNARRVFETLVRKFPDANEAKIAQEKINEL